MFAFLISANFFKKYFLLDVEAHFTNLGKINKFTSKSHHLISLTKNCTSHRVNKSTKPIGYLPSTKKNVDLSNKLWTHYWHLLYNTRNLSFNVLHTANSRVNIEILIHIWRRRQRLSHARGREFFSWELMNAQLIYMFKQKTRRDNSQIQFVDSK